MEPLKILNQEIIACVRCPRLVAYRAEVGRVKRRAYRDWDYWAKPVPGFGDPHARLLLIGLAPGAHGANRTGRMFTGDSSGDFLYKVLHATGFASQPTSISRDDGLRLRDAYLSAVARCAPPDNKPTREEIRTCRPYLVRDLELLKRVQVVVALGRVASVSYTHLSFWLRKGRSQAGYEEDGCSYGECSHKCVSLECISISRS